MSVTTTSAPADVDLVSVRGQRWVVSKVNGAGRSTPVSLQSVEDGRYGDIVEVKTLQAPLRKQLYLSRMQGLCGPRRDAGALCWYRLGVLPCC